MCAVFLAEVGRRNMLGCADSSGKSLDLRKEECGVFGRDGKPDCHRLDLNLCGKNRKGAKVAKVVQIISRSQILRVGGVEKEEDVNSCLALCEFFSRIGFDPACFSPH